jgi:hypothetical protein
LLVEQLGHRAVTYQFEPGTGFALYQLLLLGLLRADVHADQFLERLALFLRREIAGRFALVPGLDIEIPHVA